jgi:hypothetical protein
MSLLLSKHGVETIRDTPWYGLTQSFTQQVRCNLFSKFFLIYSLFCISGQALRQKEKVNERARERQKDTNREREREGDADGEIHREIV